jgi:hypothetical protein
MREVPHSPLRSATDIAHGRDAPTVRMNKAVPPPAFSIQASPSRKLPMDVTDALVEQHVKEAELRMRRVDELMARARDASVPAVDDGPLARIEAERDALHAALQRLQQGLHPHARSAASAGQGLTGRLQSLGEELERVLTAVSQR